MRKYFQILLAVFMLVVFPVVLQAQDVIITKASQKIEAKILEVSTSEVKYKKQNNLEGPVFVMATTEINSVIYANGEVQLFDTEADDDSTQIESTSAPIVEPNGEIVFRAIDWHGEVLPQIVYQKIQLPGSKKKGNRYVGDGVIFTEKEMEHFLMLYCPVAYENHLKALSYEAGAAAAMGWSFAGGAALHNVALTHAMRTLEIYNVSCAGYRDR